MAKCYVLKISDGKTSSVLRVWSNLEKAHANLSDCGCDITYATMRRKMMDIDRHTWINGPVTYTLYRKDIE